MLEREPNEERDAAVLDALQRVMAQFGIDRQTLLGIVSKLPTEEAAFEPSKQQSLSIAEPTPTTAPQPLESPVESVTFPESFPHAFRIPLTVDIHNQTVTLYPTGEGYKADRIRRSAPTNSEGGVIFYRDDGGNRHALKFFLEQFSPVDIHGL